MAGVSVGINADASKATRELNRFKTKTRRIASDISKGFKERIGHKMFDGLSRAAAAVPGMLNDAIKSASALNEETSKSEVVFGRSAKAIQNWAKNAAQSMGMSEVAALEASGTIGNMFRAMGMTEQKSADMSKQMVQLAADLGSFNNTSTEDAITAIGAALRGEAEPIRRYGVLLNDATLKAEAFAMGLSDGKATLDPKTKSLAAYSVILKQTTTAQGDFARTSDGLANSSKILQAKFEDLKTEVGSELLPVAQRLVDLLLQSDWSKIAGGIGEVARQFANLTGWVGKAYDNFVKLGVAEFAQKELEEQAARDREWKKELERKQAIQDVERQNEEFRKETIRRAEEANRPRKAEPEKQRQSAFIGQLGRYLEQNGREMRQNSLQAQLSSVQGQLSSGPESGLVASSMARIGGGGGVFGGTELDLQKQQTKLQEQMVSLLEEIKTDSVSKISDF